MNKHAEWLKRSTLPNDIDAAAEIERLEAANEKLRAELAAKEKVCEWKVSTTWSKTSCGLNGLGLSEVKHFKYCPNCGGKVVVK